MKKVYYFVLVVSLSFETVRCVHTVGRPCSSDGDCTGANEYCAIADYVDPPCTTGFCACQNCFILDPIIGACEATVYLTLNDPCNDTQLGHSVMPKNAHCKDHMVLCKAHHAFVDGYCVRVEPNGDFGQPCDVHDPCDSELVCGTRFSECTCPDPIKKWDSTLGQCVPREFGDYCLIDEECDSADTMGQMVCVASICVCARGLTQTQASFIDATGNLVTKIVCQGSNSTSGIAKTAKCSVKTSTALGSQLNTCDTALTCYQCPEDPKKQDYSNMDGACRALAPPPLKLLCPGQVPERGQQRRILKAGTFGNPCSSNSECTGSNELCVRTVNIEPPCQKGTCGCLPGFVPNAELGYLCVITIKRKIGDSCNAEAETPGVTYPDGSTCTNGTITCKPHHAIGTDGECMRSSFEGWIDSSCSNDNDCEGDLSCISSRCGCSSAYKWSAEGSGRCVYKEIGDACSSDSDCASASSGGASAVCFQYMCACPPGFATIPITEFDPLSDTYTVTKMVCLIDGGVNNQSSHSQCNLDRSSALCRSPLVCYRCLEDNFDTGRGICRNVRASAVVTPPPSSAGTKNKYNSVGKICRRNEDCGRNEMCNIAKFIDPPCVTGTCVCRPCYSISSQSSQCELATYHIVGDSCKISEMGTFFPPNSECNNGVVLCKPHYSPTATGGCVRSMLNGYYGAPCKTRTDCDNDLTCGYVTGKCTCPSSYMKWDSLKERCVRREFGDACSADGDCTVHGNMKEGYTYYGGACNANDGHCVCAAGYIQTSASFVDLALGQYSKRTICVQHPSIINVDRGGTCQTDPIFSSDSRIYVCSENSICFFCPEDGSLSQSANSNIGKCRTLIDVPPNPQCFPWLPTTPNVTKTTTTPRPLTVRVTSATVTTTTTTTTRPMPVAKIVRVGTICINDTDCGFNEHCQRALVDPPCTRGVCQCKSCFAQDDYTRLCMPMLQLFIGEGCTNSSLEVYPANAQCKTGLVTCKNCYNKQGQDCVKAGRTKPGEACNSVCDCDGNMFCNQQTKVCECFHAYEKWDSSKGLCVKREFGDSCSTNVECDVFGSNGQGYTYSGGRCVSSRCACDPTYTRVATGYIVNPTTGEMGEKAICVDNSSLKSANRNKGERCNLDPIWFSGDPDALASGICKSKQYCYQCPDDTTASGNDGKCRSATPATTPAKCNYQRPTRPLPPPTPPATPQLTNTVGLPCSRDVECSVNEVCIKAAVDPPCKKGLCACKSCFAIGVNGMCSQFIQLSTGDYCDEVPNEIYPTNSSCQLGIVNCKPCYLNQNGKCIRATALRPYGSRCISDCDCDGQGTYCEPDSGTCMCRQYYEKWDAANQRCLRREFGDACSNDAQCQVRGQSGAGFTYSGGACVRGQCTCGQRYSQTNTSFLVSWSSNKVTTKSLCLRDGIEVNRTKGQACGVDPIYNSDDAVAALGSCTSDTFCYQCPDDLDLPNFRSSDGLCRNTGSVPASSAASAPIAPQDCFSTYRTLNTTRTTPLLGGATAAPPPRIAGGGSGYVCSTKGFIMDLLLEHGENRPFASFQLSLLRACASIADCRTNEACVVPETLANGFCACQPPNFLGSDGTCRTVGSMPTASSRTPTTWVRLRIGG